MTERSAEKERPKGVGVSKEESVRSRTEKRIVCFAHKRWVVPGAQERWEDPRVVDTRSRKKRCQPFSYDSPGTLERGTQLSLPAVR